MRAEWGGAAGEDGGPHEGCTAWLQGLARERSVDQVLEKTRVSFGVCVNGLRTVLRREDGDERIDVGRQKVVQGPRGRASKRPKSFLLRGRKLSSSCSQSYSRI